MCIYTVVYHYTCKIFQAMKNMSSWDATDLRWSGILPSSWSLPLGKAFWYHLVCLSSWEFPVSFHMPLCLKKTPDWKATTTKVWLRWEIRYNRFLNQKWLISNSVTKIALFEISHSLAMVLYFCILKQIFYPRCQENVIYSHVYLERGNCISIILPFKEINILSFNLPTLIHFLGSMLSSCAHSWKSSSGWLVCLFDTCYMKDFHLAKIKSWKPDFVEVEHQKMWFFTAFTHCAITLQPFSLLATCHWSKKWVTEGDILWSIWLFLCVSQKQKLWL